MAVAKVILNDVSQIDLTSDTVTAESLLSGVTAHDASGTQITGTASGGETMYVAPISGMYYTPNMVIPSTATSFQNSLFKGAIELVSLEANALLSAYQFQNALQNCSKLESVSWPRQTTYQGGNTNTFVGCQLLKFIQLGSIGYPVTRIDFNTKSNSGKTITIYCTSIADVTIQNSPADSGDTVIYRDSTTGEVLTA